MKKTIINILACILVYGSGFAGGFVAARIYRNTQIVKSIPSQREIQQKLTDLNEPRYDPNGVDGWIGKDSRTAWDAYICDMHAKREFEGR